MSADPVTPATGNEQDVALIRRYIVGDPQTRAKRTRSEVLAALDSLVAALSAATTERDEALAQVGAATTILAEAEKIVPGVITTAGRFAIGLNDRERAVAAEQALAQTREALIELRAWAIASASQSVLDLINAALAAGAPAATLNEPERWPCGCVKGETPHGAGWADCEVAAAGAAPNETEQR